MAKIAPVAGALKMAATPAAAPATMSTLALLPVRKRRRRVVATEPMVPPSRIDVPSSPIAPPVPRVARAPINLKGSGRVGQHLGAVVVRLQVRVAGGGVGVADPNRDLGDREPDGRDGHRDPERRIAQPVEADVDRMFEADHGETGEGADGRREQEHVA